MLFCPKHLVIVIAVKTKHLVVVIAFITQTPGDCKLMVSVIGTSHVTGCYPKLFALTLPAPTPDEEKKLSSIFIFTLL